MGSQLFGEGLWAIGRRRGEAGMGWAWKERRKIKGAVALAERPWRTGKRATGAKSIIERGRSVVLKIGVFRLDRRSV
jgi:hypothetical protein